MKPCPYCGKSCKPTREHLIPDWYSHVGSQEGHEIFNARRPTKHLRGDVEIKDVCGGVQQRRFK